MNLKLLRLKSILCSGVDGHFIPEWKSSSDRLLLHRLSSTSLTTCFVTSSFIAMRRWKMGSKNGNSCILYVDLPHLYSSSYLLMY
mmetsp:Transcript_5332/g.11297  ORF Transcript_5332/g.11297 Transcript_5332/m.11297 type:complete len:85 (+) Transcript_5332:1659-1913(+)